MQKIDSRSGVLDERESLIVSALETVSPELQRMVIHTVRGAETFIRRINPDGRPGGWVHESAKVARFVSLPLDTIVDRYARVEGIGTVAGGLFIAACTVHMVFAD